MLKNCIFFIQSSPKHTFTPSKNEKRGPRRNPLSIMYAIFILKAREPDC